MGAYFSCGGHDSDDIVDSVMVGSAARLKLLRKDTRLPVFPTHASSLRAPSIVIFF